ADQSQTVIVALSKSLVTIARVTARSTGGAFQPNQTTDTYSVTQQQINSIQGNALNISESNLITALPGASYDSSGYPVIHGGRENEEGFQFEGIPYTDAFTNQFTNTLATPGLGVQSVQLTPGAGNATFGNTGTGTLNMVAKRGTYPGYVTAQLSVGGPNFFHAANLEWGTASADGRYSNYMTFAGQDFSPSYTYAPAAQIFRFGSLRKEYDREFLNNFIYRFGRNNSQSVQFFVDIADHHFYEGYGGNPYCFKTCDPIFQDYVNSSLGEPITQNQIEQIMALDPYQVGPAETLAQANRTPHTYYQPNITYKLQYNANLNDSTYLSARYYRVNAVTTFDFPYASTSATYPAFVLQQGGFTNGATLELTKQLNSKNLLEFGADYAYLRPVYDEPSNNWGFLALAFNNLEQYDFISPTDPNCGLGPGGCGYLYNYFPNGTRIPPNEEASIMRRQDYSLYVNDRIDFSDKLRAEVGLRMDAANLQLPAPGIDRATCTTLYLPATWTPPTAANWNPSAGNFTCDASATFNVTSDETQPKIFQPRLGLSYRPTTSDAIRVTYGRSVLFPPLGQMDLIDPPGYYAAFSKVPAYFNPAVAAAFGLPFVPTPQCGIPGYQVACANYAEQLRWDNQNTFQGVPLQPVKPETFSNYQLTWEHQFTKGRLNGVGFSIGPWYRKGYDAVASTQTPKIGPNGQPLTNPDGSYVYNPAVATNKGTNFATGLDVRITKEVQYGLSAQVSMSYVNEFSNVIPLSSNEDFFPTLPPASLALGNLYRVGFLSPFQTVLALDYKTRSGWRFNPQFYYDVGYPIGEGLLTSAYINGVPYNIPNTNVSAAFNTAPSVANQFVDPMNPGSLFDPNIIATRGSAEENSAGGKLSHPEWAANMTVEYQMKNRNLIGLTVSNLFNNIYSGAWQYGYNDRYQPIATGISGPLTGWALDSNSYAFPQLGYLAQYPSFIHGQEAYLNAPNQEARTFYVYYQTHI
ncbi:MAG: TonB-dependent receptor, partial [Candidatus Eremiobacteraeota bacterium]|nr:TonB-dependent receptor [Candidatus Eremiobacteraeota bacterium]